MTNQKRLTFLRIITCFGFIAGIVFSQELWFPVARTFPRAPIFFEVSAEITLLAERLLSVILSASLLAAIFVRRNYISLISALVSLLLMVSFDQNRLQPWVYQYALILIVFVSIKNLDTDDVNAAFGLIQLLIAGLYFWSGIQKMNFTFAHETFPFLLAAFENLFPAVKSSLPLLGIAAAITEILIGVALLFRRTRNSAVATAVAMHSAILILLIFKNYNSIVWIWNAVLIASVIAAFWKNDVSIRAVFFEYSSSGWKNRAAKIVVISSLILPILSFAGWWDLYLSGALYSGNTQTAVVRINEDMLDKLPMAARRTVFQPQNGKFTVLPVFEWAMSELNVPPYPEHRVFKNTARAVCHLTGDTAGVELIVKERPAILDGNYGISRTTCAELEK